MVAVTRSKKKYKCSLLGYNYSFCRGNYSLMKIETDTVVLFHYKLLDADGGELEISDEKEPVAYLHGRHVMVPKLESELEGKQAGDCLLVTIEEPYGAYRDEAVIRVPIKHLKGNKKPKVGEIALVNSKEGSREVMVLKVGRFNVDVDTNHPYAGMTLTYDVEIVNVREATEEELSHGHAHGPGGHQH